jgi:hypothetical protein
MIEENEKATKTENYPMHTKGVRILKSYKKVSELYDFRIYMPEIQPFRSTPWDSMLAISDIINQL